MSEETNKHVHRLCPCDHCDVEGIQSWLEDMAAEGLFLVEDGIFCGVFSFERKTPQKLAYRLDVAQKRKPRFMDSGDDLTDDELESYRSMGWEYLLRYGDFRVYRSTPENVIELNTESKTHAITIGLLKKKYRSSFVSTVLMVLFWLFFSHNTLSYSFQIAVSIGVVFLLCVHGIMLDGLITMLLRLFRFRRYEKRLLAGDNLNHHIAWKKTAPLHYFARVLPFLLSFGIALGLLSSFAKEGSEIPNAEYPGEPPFATVADVFPGGTISESTVWMDYGTFKAGKTAIAKNIEWNECYDVRTEDGENYFCILRLTYHETVSEWIAQGLEKDYYTYDSTRYRGKRFEDISVPDLGVDSVRVYSNYGSLYVLMREGNRLVHAVVFIDDHTNQNQWLLWAQAMAEMLKES